MFFATFTSTLALGEHIKESTNGLMGLNEYLMMNSAAGMLHSIIGCQPLLVLRPTGPITLLFEKLLTFADQHSLPFWPFFAWTGIFVGLLMFLIAAFEVSKYVKHLTLFTENIFATFIGIVYINDGIQGMIRLWENPPVGDSLPHSRYGSQDAASKLLTLSLGWNSSLHLCRGDKQLHWFTGVLFRANPKQILSHQRKQMSDGSPRVDEHIPNLSKKPSFPVQCFCLILDLKPFGNKCSNCSSCSVWGRSLGIWPLDLPRWPYGLVPCNLRDFSATGPGAFWNLDPSNQRERERERLDVRKEDWRSSWVVRCVFWKDFWRQCIHFLHSRVVIWCQILDFVNKKKSLQDVDSGWNMAWIDGCQLPILDNSSIACLVKASGMTPCQERLCSHDHTLCFHLHSCLPEAHLAGHSVGPWKWKKSTGFSQPRLRNLKNKDYLGISGHLILKKASFLLLPFSSSRGGT